MARVLMGALIAIAIGQPGEATAARTLLADLMARTTAQSGTRPMSALALEACLRRAQELDREGIAIDYEIAAIDREAAEALMLQKQINAELPVLGNFDEPALTAFQRRVIRHEELTKKFHVEFPHYEQRQKAYDTAVAEFERYCAGRFTRGDLDAVKSKLDLK
ncbi:MAG TPA: hypothetical protein VHQ92_02115 [Pseudolabrys sp.]|jgi:hypothetical protein|nr:hypothetical protein [Pseudolabrys sp.]